MRYLIKIVVIIGAIVTLPIVALWSWFYFNGSHTKYCPLSHRMSDVSVCYILDEMDDVKLIQHGCLDNNWYYLEIRRNNVSEKYKFPEYIHLVGEGDYSAKLIKDDKSHILINGKPFTLVPYEESN